MKLFSLPSMILPLVLVASAAFAKPGANALGGHVGGGEATASNLQKIINDLDAYLLSPAGQIAFPEIEQPRFHEIIEDVRPVVKDERVTDEFGVAQTCISNAVAGNRYVQCDLSRLPKLEHDNQPTLYRMMFHELLFQAGLERPISKDVPSDFRISSRLKLHHTRKREWALGNEGTLSSRENRFPLRYQGTLHFGPDYRASTTQVTVAKFLAPDTLLGLRLGHRRSNLEDQLSGALQYKRFVDNSFYVAPEIYYLNYFEDMTYGRDFEVIGLGIGVRVGNQWQWENFTMGVDWIGVGKNLAHFRRSDPGTDVYTATLFNFYLGLSF
jgi:hypothetical protein